MEPVNQPTTFERGELRFKIPAALLEVFAQNPRVVIKERPDGLWPVDPDILQSTEVFQKLVTNKEFTKNFEVVIMHK